ncbi:MAG: UTP--glucose-1-phosphate uridylyltransferase GalU [Gammaproteobacteria bacterium]
MQITKAVFPVAGMGTRFLPATKANPKEMLPIVDKPLIQYAVEEAVAAGIRDLIFVTSSSKRAIEDHFDSNFELETKLAERGKTDLLKLVQQVLPEGINCCYVRQQMHLGLGHAVLCAREVVGHEPFAVLLADDLIDSSPRGCLKQMVDVFSETQQSVIAVESIPAQETQKYGVIGFDDEKEQVKRVSSIVEKPKPADAPSQLGVVGRYVLTPAIFECLSKTAMDDGGEVQLTDAISTLLSQETVNALQFEGRRYDCGSKLGYLEATVEYALKHPELSGSFRTYLEKMRLEKCKSPS